MVYAVINISDYANRILKIIKAKYDLRDKSQAIDMMAEQYGGGILEPELRPEYVEKMRKVQKET
ncbi:antitoxin, partial [Candidatus Micrarchaeota archaeon CG11_big_fil_rev_8_21_14_0_20_47_5]